jgi:hypothetical protein
MTYSIVLLGLLAVGLAAPKDQPVAHGEFWPSLAEMTSAERANSEIWLEPAPGSAPEAYDEARAISELWNRGEYEAAIERARGFSRYGDPSQVVLALNPRVLVRSEPRLGDDIRIGTRDTLYGCSFDRLHNGWLFASFPGRAGDHTYIYSYRSTDNGATWEELAQLQWNRADYVRATTAVCHGDYLVIFASLRAASCNLALVGRISTTTGELVRFPGDTLLITAFQSDPGDTLVEFATASSEDAYPGWEVYLFGRTSAGALKCAWTDSSCRAWRSRKTNIQTACNNGLDCSFNAWFRSKYIWVSWLMPCSGDSACVCHGHFQSSDTFFHCDFFSGCYAQQNDGFLPTAVSAYRDTVAIAYLLHGLKQVGLFYWTDCEVGAWRYTALTDTWVTRDAVEISLRRGGGCALAHRDHIVADRRMLFQHAPQVEGPYSEPDTISEHMPDQAVRIKIEKLNGSEYGLVWVSTNDAPFGAAYFDRVSVSGIEEPERPRLVPLGLEALTKRGGVRLAFDNPVSGPVRVRVFDLTGRLEFGREEHMSAGKQAIDLMPQASGVYFAVVDAAGRRASVRLTFAR